MSEPQAQNEELLAANRELQARVEELTLSNNDLHSQNATLNSMAEERLSKSEVRYRTLFNSIDEGYALCELVYGADGKATDVRYVEVNPAFEKLSGLENAPGKTARQLNPRLEPLWIESAAKVAETGEAVRFEEYAEGLDRWIDIHFSRVVSWPTRAVAVVFNDVTQRKRAEQVLRESEAWQAFLLKLSDALRPLADAVEIQEVASQLLGEHLNANRVYYCEIADNVVIIHRDYAPDVPSMAGKYPFEIWGRRLMEAYYRGDNFAIEDVHSHPVFAGEDLSAYDKAGFTSGILISLPKRPDWGAMLGVASRMPRTWTQAEVRLAEEVAERTWAAVERASIEEALRESEARFRAVADLVPDLLWRTDPQGVTNWHNQRWYEYTGQSLEQTQGYGWLDAIHPEDREQSLKNFQEAIETGKPLHQEHRIRASDGSYRWFLVQAKSVRDENGRIVQWFGAATDIHEERMAREELEQRVAERTAELARANQALRRLSARMLEVQEEERRSITRELHDEIGQYLAGLKLMIGEVKPESEVMARRLAAIQEVLTDLAGRVSTLSLDLRPPMLDDMGLLPALLWYVQRYTKRTGIEVDFRHMGLQGRLPAEVETVVYRVAQEALTNAASHSGANHVTLQVLTDSKITIIIEDEGKGFDAQQAPAQHVPTGIAAMRERVELVGGQFAIESSPGRGTTVIVEIPIHSDPT